MFNFFNDISINQFDHLEMVYVSTIKLSHDAPTYE